MSGMINCVLPSQEESLIITPRVARRKFTAYALGSGGAFKVATHYTLILHAPLAFNRATLGHLRRGTLAMVVVAHPN
jgi:hypothetical protein